MTGCVLAVDIGGTKLAAALVEPGGRIAAYERIATPQPPHADAETLWRTMLSLIDRLPATGLAGVGVGCGGPMSWPAGKVSPLNIPAWRGFPLRERLQERYPDLPVRVHNDAIAFAAGEHWRGAGRGRGDMLGMVVSTGVGGGLILGGRLVDGVSGNAGHIGHVIVDHEGPVCECGGRGCLEAIARGPALAAWAREQGWLGETAKELADDAARGHPVAVRAMNRAGWALGVAIASATHLCDLEVVAIGGGLSQAGPLLFRPLEDTLRAHARMDFARQVRVVPAALGQMAGLIGAAALVLAEDRYWTAEE
ncbi:ROK family protein [Actinoallomurus rhizosphaericola]|uniref:ROK family protein n=1 Tax=Actinoallomurus rhizosphaericola TaxID=2952536 RepID=UPI002091CC40|nr:ROK family protein [Actinoallomurus rhizosphaericola]MCO5992751.1 ROK family protein [Actinoallomurus rhizosphaericola]